MNWIPNGTCTLRVVTKLLFAHTYSYNDHVTQVVTMDSDHSERSEEYQHEQLFKPELSSRRFSEAQKACLNVWCKNGMVGTGKTTL